MRKSSHKFRKMLASVLALIMVTLSTSFFTVISVFAADGDVSYLAPVYDTDGNVTFDADGDVVMEEKMLADGKYNVVTASTTVMGTTDTAAEADANGEYWYVVNANVTLSTRIVVSGKVHLILCDGFELNDSKGIQVSEGNEFTVYGQENGTGTLTCKGWYSAAIGGNSSEANSGKITLNGGTVNATGTTDYAAIGTGSTGTSGAIKIYGGTIFATGKSNAACIGNAVSGDFTSIEIYGGDIQTSGGYFGIGAANTKTADGESSSYISIYGGTIETTTIGQICYNGYRKVDINIHGGDINATFIGNSSGDSGQITITGGKVVVQASRAVTNGIAAIGAGSKYTGTVTITGGYIEAYGGGSTYGGAGIGGGYLGHGKVTISGGCIIAEGGPDADGIGSGYGVINGYNFVFGGSVGGSDDGDSAVRYSPLNPTLKKARQDPAELSYLQQVFRDLTKRRQANIRDLFATNTAARRSILRLISFSPRT